MKKLTLMLIALTLLLASCGTTPEYTGDTSEQNDSNNRSPSRQAMPFYTGSSAFYTGERLYFIENNLLSYLNIKTGETYALCYDPLCDHYTGENNDINLESDCPAIVCNSLTAKIIVDTGDDGAQFVYFNAEDPKTNYSTIYRFDVSGMERSVLVSSENIINRIWLYGDTLYYNMMTTRQSDDGKTYYSGGDIYAVSTDGGKSVQLTEMTGGESVKLIGVDGGYFYFCYDYSCGDIYRTPPDFSTSEKVSGEINSIGITVYNGYIYYMVHNGEEVAVCDAAEGDFDKDISNANKKTVWKYDYYRISVDGASEPELVVEGVQAPLTNAALNSCTFFIDKDCDTAYVVPCDPSYDGYIIWEQSSDTIKSMMNLSGKPVVTYKFSSSSGRLVAVDLDTLEKRDVLSGTGSDIIDIYDVSDGVAAVNCEVYDTKRLRLMLDIGEKLNSMLNYYEKILVNLN